MEIQHSLISTLRTLKTTTMKKKKKKKKKSSRHFIIHFKKGRAYMVIQNSSEQNLILQTQKFRNTRLIQNSNSTGKCLSKLKLYPQSNSFSTLYFSFSTYNQGCKLHQHNRENSKNRTEPHLTKPQPIVIDVGAGACNRKTTL